MKSLVVDIDGTLFESFWNGKKYIITYIYEDEIVKLNNLRKKFGIIIILYTGRNWDKYKMTKKQLKRIGIKYDELVMGKPQGDFYIDKASVKSVSEIL